MGARCSIKRMPPAGQRKITPGRINLGMSDTFQTDTVFIIILRDAENFLFAERNEFYIPALQDVQNISMRI